MSISRLLAFLRRLFSSRRAERDLHDDVQAFADLLADDLASRGLPRAEAERRARATLGGVEPVKESVRGIRAGAWLEQVWRDLQYAWRGLARAPAFTVTAVLTVALGVGINTTIFTVVDATLFKPLPYERPHELVRFHQAPGISPPVRMTWAEVLEWRTQRDLFQGVEVSTGGYLKDWLEGSRSVIISAFSPGLPALLGIRPTLGRVFTPDEADAKSPVVLIADVLWRDAFARNPDVLGTAMTIGGRAFTVIGVMPPGFRYGPGGGGILEVWMPMPERPDPDIPERLSPIFRVRNGLPLHSAQAGTEVVAGRMQAELPADQRRIPHLVPFTGARLLGLTDRMPGGRASMVMLLAAAGLVLLVACASVAGLLLTRGEGRRTELALRTALGASRGRLARLLLAEGALVAALGGAAAVLTAHWTTAGVVSLMPSDMQRYMFTASEAVIDGRVLGFALAATSVVALAASVWPAMTGARAGLRAALGTGGQVTGDPTGRRRAGRLLLSGQVALAFLLAITACLFSTSFARMLTEDLGYDPHGLGVVSFGLPEGAYDGDDARRIAVDRLLGVASATPGVRGAAIGGSPARRMPGDLVLPGDTDPIATTAERIVGPGYFDTAGIPLVAGRDFDARDRRGAPRVAIIDEPGARRVFGETSPIGRRFRHHPAIPEATIVGVVGAVAATDFVQGPASVGVYFPEAQQYPFTSFVVRADATLPATLARVRAALEAAEPGIAVTAAGPATDAYVDAETLTRPRFYVVLVSAFALLAVVSAAVGLYGLLAHAVARRQREIGVRVALGSTPGQIRRLVLAEALVPVGAGLALGGVAAWWTLGLVGSLLYEIGPRDPWAFGLAAVALGVASLLGLVAPVRRATGVDPIVALRMQ
jgi:putative ABC transport system permease protein